MSAVSLSLVLLALLFATHRLIHGRRVGFSPLAAFGIGWILAVGLYVWNPIAYIPLTRWAWVLIVLGTSGFVAGYAVAIVVQRGQDRDLELPAAPAHPDVGPLRALCLVCVVAAGILFLMYVRYIVGRFGLGNPAQTMYQARSTIAEGAPTIGFYFFYFAELVVPTSVVVAVETRLTRYWLLAAGATMALLATTGRTNATKAVIWSVFVLVLRRGTRRLRIRNVVLAAGAAGLVLVFFTVLGGSVGKTYHNSYIAQAHPVTPPPMPTSLALPYEYITAPLPTFSEVVRNDPHDEGGRNSFRPVYQVVRVFDAHVVVASKVQRDQYTPYRYNVSTYLYPLWRDFGAPGVVVGSLLFGVVCGRAYLAWLARGTPAVLCVAALATLAAFVSSGDAQFNELSWLFQAALLCWVARRERLALSDTKARPTVAPA